MRQWVETAADLATFGVGMTALLAVGVPLTVAAHVGRLAVTVPTRLMADG